MKTFGSLWNIILSTDNLLSAWDNVERRRRTAPAVVSYRRNLEERLDALQRVLRDGTYQPQPYRMFRIMDPKPREIYCASLDDRVVHHALCDVISPMLERTYIPNTYACRVGMGSHRAARLALGYVRRYKYFLKLDIHHYFASVDGAILKEVITRRFREKSLKHLIEVIIDHATPEGGLPIGNLTSQWFANTYLDAFDHLWERKDLAYIRYMDDMVFFSDSKKELWSILETARTWLVTERHLTLKEKATYLATTAHGLPFLGLTMNPLGWRLQHNRYWRTIRKWRAQYKALKNQEITCEEFMCSIHALEGSIAWYGLEGALRHVIPAEEKKIL